MELIATALPPAAAASIAKTGASEWVMV